MRLVLYNADPAAAEHLREEVRYFACVQAHHLGGEGDGGLGDGGGEGEGGGGLTATGAAGGGAGGAGGEGGLASAAASMVSCRASAQRSRFLEPERVLSRLQVKLSWVG